MSRERLEEIRTRLKFGLVCLKHLRREILNSDDESLKYQVNLLENDIRYLFKQAKRVHELEDKLELVMDRHTYLEGDYYSLQQQNKRYREALEKIARINIEQGTVTVSEVHAVLTARKALEGEK